MLVKIAAGFAGVALAVAIVASALRLLRRLEDAAANAGVSETATATR